MVLVKLMNRTFSIICRDLSKVSHVYITYSKWFFLLSILLLFIISCNNYELEQKDKIHGKLFLKSIRTYQMKFKKN